ncbi:hypothetical protein DPMN_107260 [Dreissena polymorpha]|uniref:Uncharacterized protein n=1 Tax=Dreissena polymorpha TaxID=45954 RepID=A0A9D4K6R2_DREPO|nr:hypothetical protein DPMN_107257 [Dreissena polymorpha]KAH3833944.1 hypothetical protein DPMN_107260 [Dreissena polymorpha]
MWSSSAVPQSTNKFTPNHFVPLIKKKTVESDEIIQIADETMPVDLEQNKNKPVIIQGTKTEKGTSF